MLLNGIEKQGEGAGLSAFCLLKLVSKNRDGYKRDVSKPVKYYSYYAFKYY